MSGTQDRSSRQADRREHHSYEHLHHEPNASPQNGSCGHDGSCVQVACVASCAPDAARGACSAIVARSAVRPCGRLRSAKHEGKKLTRLRADQLWMMLSCLASAAPRSGVCWKPLLDGTSKPRVVFSRLHR